MTDEMMDLFDELDANTEQVTRDVIIRAPFPYPGGKSRSIEHIIPLLPASRVYVEPFGGSAAVLLSKRPCKLEVFNDRYAGVVAFYRCMRDKDKFNQLYEKIHLTVHSREDFVFCRDTWQDCADDVERAFRWYYMICYSFGSLGRNFGRTISGQGRLSGKIRNHLEHFDRIHTRFKTVQVENQDWYTCLLDYDSEDTVFYIDPPYVDASEGIYKSEMKHDDHRRLISTIFTLKGCCVVSGYSNPLYENNPWDGRHEWESFVSIKSIAYTESNRKEELKGIETRGKAKEVLWIKESQ